MAGMLMVFFVLIFLIVTGRFLFIQASGQVNDVPLEEWAKKKRMSTYHLHAERGKILDTNGMVLAADRMKYKIYAILDETYTGSAKEPKHVMDPEKTARTLAPITDMDEDFIANRIKEGMADEDIFQVEFGNKGKGISQQVKDEIMDLPLPGIYFEEEPSRYYPNGVFASHILGFARKESRKEDDEIIEEITGKTGIESVMNENLIGNDGYISYQRDIYEKKLLDPEEIIKKPIDGNNIYLTIDQKIQILLEDTMVEVEEEYSPERMSAVVMNAKTGEIIAMSNRPSYDPNNPTDVENWYNDVISTPFEPGSTVKMFTWAAAIDAGVYNGDEWFKSGSYQVHEKVSKVHDHNNGKGWGSITYDEGFARSSNVASSKLVWEKLGTEKYLEYLKAFDFDKKTNIDLPGEISGKILYNYPAEKLTTSFGQGSTLTPIQQLKAATAITNGGKMLEPYVIKKMVDTATDEVLEEKDPKVVGEPISKEAAEQVQELLDAVVNSKHGTGKAFKLESYSVMGKTGTAQIPDPENGGYLQGNNRNIYSFLGMAPKDDPELIMYVSVNQPKVAVHENGSEPVAFLFKSVMENSLRYLNISPDKANNESINIIKSPKVIGTNTKSTEESLTKQGLTVSTIGTGENVVDANVKEGDELFLGNRVILLTDKPKMPHIIGWSLRDLYQLADLFPFKLEALGSGYVVTQNIKEGTKIKESDYLGVELMPPNESPKEEKAGDHENDIEEDEGQDIP